MTSRIDQTSVGRREPDCVCKGWRPKEWLEPGPGTATTIDNRSPHITKSTVSVRCACNARICRLGESLRPVLRHDCIVQEIAARVLSSKVSIPVVILCDRVQREHRLAQRKRHLDRRALPVPIALDREPPRMRFGHQTRDVEPNTHTREARGATGTADERMPELRKLIDGNANPFVA